MFILNYGIKMNIFKTLDTNETSFNINMPIY